ncbi:hypothetical protein [Emticicia sp. C21]|uniref:hypothetical protein n=1 Tax=Emticicia sp. C21 TaxID=2302915 RepID=UPI0011C1AE2B|nr:hypothetical protein [Emticicia sp. C21]
MKKLFTISWRNNAQTSYKCLLQRHKLVVVDSNFLQSRVSNLVFNYGFKPEVNIRLISFNFFIPFATYRRINPLLLTYSAEITHTYRQTLTTSFNFSRPTDTLPSVLFGNVPRSFVNNCVRCNSYSSVIKKG